MAPSKPVTETVILQLKPGLNLDTLFAGRPADGGAPIPALAKLGNTLKAQAGCIRQFWGQQVENPSLFVWTVDWESFESHAAFINSAGYKDFLADNTEIFDLEVATPLMMHTTFTSGAVAAREAPVTEVAYFLISKESSEEQKVKLEDSFIPLLEHATTVGKCPAFAVGWIFEDQPHPQAANGEAMGFHALLGWPSVEAHNEFRNTREFTDAIAPIRAAVLPPSEERKMFHVNFRAFD